MDAFSDDEKEAEGGVGYLLDFSLNRGISADNMQELLYGRPKTSLFSPLASARTLKDRCHTVDSVLRVTTKDRSKSSISARGRALSRTEIKLIESGDQPLKGTLFFILYTVLYSLCFLCASYMYRRNPDLTPFQMLFMRSVFALVFQMIGVNKELKPAVWDSVNKGNVNPLIFRTIQGTATNIINYSTAKFLPLTIIAIVNNMAPMLTVVLAYLILKERIKGFEIVMIGLTIAAVVTVVVGENPESTTGQPKASTVMTYLLYGALFLNPFLTAGGSISMRKMKKFHEAVVSWYLNWGVLITSLIIIFAMGSGFGAIANFDW